MESGASSLVAIALSWLWKLPQSRHALVVLLALGLCIAVGLVISTFAALRAVNRKRRALHCANQRLLHASRHDSLTGLVGRAHFRERFEELLDEVQRGERTRIALMLIDLDYFKKINDAYGHWAGDAVLVDVARRFTEVFGSANIVGRLGGDEFAVILPDADSPETVKDLADRLIERVKMPIIVDGDEMTIGASVGIVLVECGAEGASALTGNADLALYEAKRRGRGTSVIYRPAMRAAIEDREMLESDLAVALKNGELMLCYQPIVRADDEAVVCREALMRWNHPVRGLLYPDLFIPLAENRQFIQQIGAWLMRSACDEAVRWEPDVSLALNISTVQLLDPGFLKIVVEALAASGFPARRLILEFDETIFADMNDGLLNLLQSLHVIGVQLALDHFGRGCSSLSYLERLNLSAVKIHREYVQAAAAGSGRNEAIVSAIVSLARSLDLTITAEGVETPEQAAIMHAMGCTHLQGFHFGRPEPRVAAAPAPVPQLQRA